MEQEIVDEVEGVPVAAWLSVDKKNRYGSVPGLEDEELADPEELEQQVYIEMFGPILRLPYQAKHSGIKPNIDEDGQVDFGAFGTVDFDRIKLAFDGTRYRIEKLREEQANIRILFDISFARVTAQPELKYRVLKYVGRGILDVDDIMDFDLWLCGKMYLWMGRLHRRIQKLQAMRRERRQGRCTRWLEEEP